MRKEDHVLNMHSIHISCLNWIWKKDHLFRIQKKSLENNTFENKKESNIFYKTKSYRILI